MARNQGVRFECLRMKPHDHVGWIFSGPREFADLAGSFLAEGAARGELLMYVAEDPRREDLGDVAGALGEDRLQIARIADVYGESGIVDAAAQRATFASVLGDALAAGFSGIRVAADNSALVADEARLRAWIQWEMVADRFMSENLVTGLCAFDREKVQVDQLRHLSTLHPLSSAGSPVPQFRMFSDDGGLCIEGEMDSSAVAQLWLALDHLPPRTGVLVDLSAVRVMSRAVLAGLRQLCEAGIAVTIRGEAAALKEFGASGSPQERLILQEV